jgi:hypothetical protein
MHALTSVPLPQHDEKTDAVVLYSEEILEVQPSGKMKEIDRVAYKILRVSGRRLGNQYFPFDPDSRITSIRGWCIPAQGKDFEVRDKDLEERGHVNVENGILFSDLKVKVMDIPAPEPGNILGYEIEQEQRPYVLQYEWFFQHQFPVADAQYTLKLPAGWEYKAVWVNHPEVAASSLGNNQWHWQLKDIPEVKPEGYMPPWKGIAGLMIVSLVPPSGAGRGFLTWSEMGGWYGQLIQGRREASPEIKQKVTELTAQAPTPLGKMRALAEFMQKDIRYVAISLGIGGFQPHPAKEVFAHRYGDCKDKATLLSGMLKEVGIDSYYVVIHTERGGVSPSTPPHLGAFNHVILAIHLPDSVSDASLIATIQDPKLGRLLFFDPTDELTAFGELHGALQANYALLVTPDGGELTQLPQLPATTNGVTRTAKFKLDGSGTLAGEVHEQRVGDAAWRERMALRYVEKDVDRIKRIETIMGNSLSSFQITKASILNLKEKGVPFGYEWSFVALNYGKSAGNLLLVRPRVLGVEAAGLLETKEERKYPIEFPGPVHNSDSYEITLPAGYEVDDLPPAADADFGFGSYHSKFESAGNVLRYTRTYEIKELSVPVSQAADLKKFFRIIASDERNTAVLKPVAH